MYDISLDDENAYTRFYKKLKQFESYIKYLENDVPANKRTKKENELIKKYGRLKQLIK